MKKKKNLVTILLNFYPDSFARKAVRQLITKRGMRSKASFKTHEDGCFEREINLYSFLLCCSLKHQHKENVIYYFFIHIHDSIYGDHCVKRWEEAVNYLSV